MGPYTAKLGQVGLHVVPSACPVDHDSTESRKRRVWHWLVGFGDLRHRGPKTGSIGEKYGKQMRRVVGLFGVFWVNYCVFMLYYWFKMAK